LINWSRGSLFSELLSITFHFLLSDTCGAEPSALKPLLEPKPKLVIRIIRRNVKVAIPKSLDLICAGGANAKRPARSKLGVLHKVRDRVHFLMDPLGEVEFAEMGTDPQWRDGTTYSREPNFKQRCSNRFYFPTLDV
jgi:hypothetical protein